MTGGMAFIYDEDNTFDKFVNSTSVIWQIPQTDYWISHLEKLIKDYFSETNSNIAKKILSNFKNEIKNFKQVCPIEMLDKLKNPISTKQLKSISA